MAETPPLGCGNGPCFVRGLSFGVGLSVSMCVCLCKAELGEKLERSLGVGKVCVGV